MRKKAKATDIGRFINKSLTDLIDWAKKPSENPQTKHSLSDQVKEELQERTVFEVRESLSTLSRFTN